jgi:hypothetical protein
MTDTCRQKLFPITVGGKGDERAACIIHDQRNNQIIVAGNSTNSISDFVPSNKSHGFVFAVDF